MSENKEEIQTPLDKVLDEFGSAVELADILGMSRSNITHWKTRHNGLIPSDYHRAILLAAKNQGLNLKASDLVDYDDEMEK